MMGRSCCQHKIELITRGGVSVLETVKPIHADRAHRAYSVGADRRGSRPVPFGDSRERLEPAGDAKLVPTETITNARMKVSESDEAELQGGLETPVFDEDSGDWLTAEQIVATRKLGKLGVEELELLVRWDNEETTWQPATRMAEIAPHLVREFRAGQARTTLGQSAAAATPQVHGNELVQAGSDQKACN